MALAGRSSRHGCCSTAGRRAINQDRAATLALSNSRYVAVIADGMGGARAGDVASDAALRAFVRVVQTANDGDEAALRSAFAAADAAIRDAATPEREGMGSTLVAAIARDREVWIGNIGDSRAVLVTGDEVVRLSTEHSVVGEALRNGRITEVEALRHPERHVVLRALGDGDIHPDVNVRVLQPASGRAVVLLGSDGLFNFIGDFEILELAENARSAAEVAERLVRRAVENGSDDNVSAAAIVIDRHRRSRLIAALLTVLVLIAIAAAAYPYRQVIAARVSLIPVDLLRTFRSPGAHPRHGTQPPAAPPAGTTPRTQS